MLLILPTEQEHCASQKQFLLLHQILLFLSLLREKKTPLNLASAEIICCAVVGVSRPPRTWEDNPHTRHAHNLHLTLSGDCGLQSSIWYRLYNSYRDPHWQWQKWQNEHIREHTGLMLEDKLEYEMQIFQCRNPKYWSTVCFFPGSQEQFRRLVCQFWFHGWQHRFLGMAHFPLLRDDPIIGRFYHVYGRFTTVEDYVPCPRTPSPKRPELCTGIVCPAKAACEAGRQAGRHSYLASDFSEPDKPLWRNGHNIFSVSW